MCGMNINMGNVNCHEWVMSNESHRIVGGMLVCQCRVHKNGVSNPPLYRPRPFSPFPKIYTKLVNKHVPPTGEMGEGGWKLLKNGCHPGLNFVSSPYVLMNKMMFSIMETVTEVDTALRAQQYLPGTTKHGSSWMFTVIEIN